MGIANIERYDGCYVRIECINGSVYTGTARVYDEDGEYCIDLYNGGYDRTIKCRNISSITII